MTIDARLDVLERRILAQGETPEEWAVEVTKPVDGVWLTTFYVGVQSFRIAECDSNEVRTFPGGADQWTREGAEQQCMFIGRMFVKALRAFVEMEAELLCRVLLRANDQLFDSRVDDAQHQVDSHPDTLPQVFLKLAAGHEAALETLQTVVRELVEPTIGLRGAFSEDFFNADGSPVTVEQMRAREVADGVTQREILEAGVGAHLGDPAADMAAAMSEPERFGVWITTRHWAAVFGGDDWVGTSAQAYARAARWATEVREPRAPAYAGPPEVSYEVRPYTGDAPASAKDLAAEKEEFERLSPASPYPGDKS